MSESILVSKGCTQVMAQNRGSEYGMENNSDTVVGDLVENKDRNDVFQKQDSPNGHNIRRAPFVDISNVAEPKQNHTTKSQSTWKRFGRRATSQRATGVEGTNTDSKKRHALDTEVRIGLKKRKDDMLVDYEKMKTSETEVRVT